MAESTPLRNLDAILSDLIRLTDNCNSRESTLQRLTELCCEAFRAKACTLVETDLTPKFLKHIAYAGFDSEFKRHIASREVKPDVQEISLWLDHSLISQDEITERNDLQKNGGGIVNPEIARRYKLNSALCKRLTQKSQTVRFLSVFSSSKKNFSEKQKKLLELFSYQAEMIFEKFEAARNLEILEKTNSAALKMVKATGTEKIYQILLRTAIEITGAKYGLIRLLNYSTGELEVVAKVGMKHEPPSLKYGKGLVWKALIDSKHQLVDDVRNNLWYFENIRETRSELVIPILLEQVPVREGKKVKLRSRPLGVLNLESPEKAAFSDNDRTILMPLVSQSALIIDGKEFEKKLRGLVDINRPLVNKNNLNEVLKIVAEGIRDKLNFEWINISLVARAGNLIKTEYVLGLDEDAAKEYKELSAHSIDENDIQSEIVRTGNIEVISGNDARFDPEIYRRFNHKDLIRVFMPIKASLTNEVIGTIEVGHKKDYRSFIDERDITLLYAIISIMAEIIDPHQGNLSAKISHEINSSIVGIRSHADYLKQRRHVVREDIVENKLSDILADCDFLLMNVKELEYFVGQSNREGKVEEVFVVRDIIAKTINQQRQFIRERGFSMNKISYPREDLRRIKIFVEKAKLNQVFTNLLINAVKYAKNNPNEFKVQITIDETPRELIIKISDWGIGIKEQYKDAIFKVGFRSPEAMSLNVNGSGFGLAIAQARMKEIGGDLILFNNSNPTVFHLRIPKSLMEKPK